MIITTHITKSALRFDIFVFDVYFASGRRGTCNYFDLLRLLFTFLRFLTSWILSHVF